MKVKEYLNFLLPDARCELNYHKDYELLMAVILSAQTTDKRVNEVTKELFQYNLKEISDLSLKEIRSIIKSLGFYTRKAEYIKKAAQILISDYEGKVPRKREYLEKIPGVGRKTANVVLNNLFGANVLAVDTHVERVSKRLGLAELNDSPLEVEEKLNNYFKGEDLGKLHHQLVLFGRYFCKAKKPKCNTCKLKKECLYFNQKQ